MGRRSKQIEREKGRDKVSLSKFINEYARSHSCISSVLETGREVSKRIRRSYRRIQVKRRRRRRGKKNS